MSESSESRIQRRLARRIPVTVLGATGLVGQRLIALLEGHPWFEVTGVAASARNVGARYGDVVRWRVESEPPPAALDLRLACPGARCGAAGAGGLLGAAGGGGGGDRAAFRGGGRAGVEQCFGLSHGAGCAVDRAGDQP